MHCGVDLSVASRRMDTAVLSYFIYEGTEDSCIQKGNYKSLTNSNMSRNRLALMRAVKKMASDNKNAVK